MIKYSFTVQTAQPNAKQKAERMQAAMLDVKQVDCPIKHYFAPGVFAREITIPEGVCVVGAVHKTDNLAIVSQGTVLVVTDSGTKVLKAPCQVLVKAGQKTAVTALESVVWTNFFPNPDNETSIDKLVQTFTESKACELIGGSKNAQLTANKLNELEN